MKSLYLRQSLVFLLIDALVYSCTPGSGQVLTGAERMDLYLPLLEDRNIAIVANHTSLVDGVHLVDTLYSLSEEHFKINIIQKVFAPEHGFRGEADAGATVGDEVDPETGIPVVSLYGEHRKPTDDDMKDIDLVVFDVQDVGVRFFTYISTLHYVMEACAEHEIPLIVLDRPNPNAAYIDGPLLEEEYRSFIGMHPVPVVYGMTIGELARMINGEGWLNNGIRCELKVIPCANYTKSTFYSLPVKPSPNLPNDHAVRIYPSTCFFEGTVISEGRGTGMPFEIYGHPDLPGDFSFTPVPIEGMSMYPKLEGQTCYGRDLRDFHPEGGWKKIHLEWLLDAYRAFPEKEEFFIPYFDKLAGTGELRKQIILGLSEEEIRASWLKDLEEFRTIRQPYLLYEL